jgi:TetR/AcrR family transcriptional regulator, tetracycline repressor protein
MARPTGQPPLTVERIVDAALALIDESGLDAFTMRRLGARLGVDPMAVYHHLPNKNAVIEAVVRHVFDNLPAPSARGTWQQRVRRWANNYRAVAAAHPNLVLQIVADPAAVAIAAVRVNEALYATLETSGLPAAHVAAAGDVIVDYVNGYVLAEAAGPHDPEGAAAAFQAELDSQPPEAVAAQRRALAAGRPQGNDGFTYGLTTILTGLEVRIE